MKQDNSISSLTRSQGKLYLHSGGSMMLNIIIIMVIFASILSAVVYMSSSSLRQAASSNKSANAWNMAEAGYRLLSVNYLKTTDSNGDGNADDEKAGLLSQYNGRTYVIPNNGSFTLTIRPYWFYNAGVTTTGNTITVRLPGTTPTGFTMPSSGRIQLGNTASGIVTYTGGSLTSGVFTCTLASNKTLNAGDPVYLVLNPNVNQALTEATGHNTLTLNLVSNNGTFSETAFPARDGLIQIGTETRLYRYSKATRQSGTNILTLTNLRHSDNTTFSTPVTTATNVIFKKCLWFQSLGQAGDERRTLSFSQAILDSTLSASVAITLNTKSDLENNFTRSTSIGNKYEVDQLTVAGGGSAWFSLINSLDTTGSGASAYQCGAFWYSKTDAINSLWLTPTSAGSPKHLLSYDVQVKMATGHELKAGTLGLAIRAKNIDTASETYLGLTFMKYSLPNLYFNRQTGTTAINYGDTVVGATSHATGIVQGTPELTSGSWAGGNAVGKIRFASVTGAFSTDEWLTVGGVNRVRVNGSNYFPAASPTDYIPQAIKPKPSDFSPARYNIGPLLLVLWERKSDGTFRWLAFKDISNDDYAKGLQDWSAPDGSCTNNCDGVDGQIINDSASVYIRIEEKRVVLGTGSAVKVNDINLFYGDSSSRYTTRTGNAIPYDIEELRKGYIIADTSFPTWVPEYISQWYATMDYFSHIESGTPPGSQPAFQWDAVNPNVTGITVFKICDDGSAACTGTVSGTLRLTELVTPDSGTYLQPEIGMIGCGYLRNPGNDYATVGFAEFAILTPGSNSGGFIDTSLNW